MESKIEYLEISDYAKNQYKRFVRGNWNDSDEIIQKKLTRNFILGYHIATYDDGVELRAYGQLYIYKKDNEVIKVGCGKGRCKGWVYINQKEKQDLNKLFGIEA
ncbi:hypothetical protein [Clostridium beijerinckii]|uniref:hypothetical protein n=1 Tax=Clostridium beijerinckii TaxID=1520 RepID=UPI00156F6CF5|nr:hypothetical protein [Clostridium beijerinckii]NRU52409.1 hypothetical protein [Clostridium beijerinckii]NYC69146.1 hypothetical protein [Clostridium beijerinckii]NYC91900.1 hypothetical protein [Clostridium beijerinckii]